MLSFEENIKTLLDELLLAHKWQRPSLLLAVHKSKFGRTRAEQALQERLEKLGHPVVHITVDPQHTDIPHLIASTPASGGVVYFVSNLDWGGSTDRRDTYRALNMYRELFVDNHVSVVFWLTTNEATSLARYAPDFWAFRHRVIEFTGERIPRQVELPAGTLLWDMQDSVELYDTVQARIDVREELLARLPQKNEARSARIDLLDNLGYLYWSKGDVEQASRKLASGLDLAVEQDTGHTLSSLHNGLAILSYEAAKYDDAQQHWDTALRASPENPILLINFCVCCHALGRNQEALTIARRALKAGGHDARIWSVLAYVYAATGKYNEAISCFAKAVELAPRASSAYLALGICYHLVERPDDAALQLDRARKLADEQAPIPLGLYEALLAGEPARGKELAQAAIRSGRLSLTDLRRDPNLSLLMDPQQMAEISA